MSRNKEKVKSAAVLIDIKATKSDGTWIDTTRVIPLRVFEDIIKLLDEFEDKYLFTYSEIEKFHSNRSNISHTLRNNIGISVALNKAGK